MTTNIIMPEMGEGVIEGTVVTWLKREGDTVKEDEAVLEIETDKVTVEINAESSGTLLKQYTQAGETVPVGTVLAVIGAPGEKPEGDDTPGTAERARPARDDATSEVVAEPGTVERVPVNGQSHQREAVSPNRSIDGVRVSPVVARMVQEHDLDVTQITGTGRNGRITKRDVLSYLDQRQEQAVSAPTAAPAPSPTAAPDAAITPQPVPDVEGELMQLSAMRRSIAEHMVLSKRTSPHATTVFEFDFSAVSKHREEHKAQFAKDGVKLTYMPYLVQATVEALKQHPMANASWTDEGIFLKRDINIGMAVAVENGLIVPVIRNADTLNLFGLAKHINDLAERARSNRLQPSEVKGGTFTITNHGSGGSLIGAPIINQPQVGILGFGLIEKRVKVINDAIAIRPCAYISFSFDHRVLDGATADAFVMAIKQRIENYA
jgi:2-oxoglutarate dehydrogenase E2 component (dihydrolipoamide succinyltransferase)